MNFYAGIFRHIFTAIFLLLNSSILIAQNVIRDSFEYRGNTKINSSTNIIAAMYNINSNVYQGTPKEIAQQFLNENKSKLGISNMSDLKYIETIHSPAGKHIGFQQTYDGIPIYGSETIVSIKHDNRVSMVVNGNISVMGLKTTNSISKIEAINNAIIYLKANQQTLVTQPEAELYIYQDSQSQFRLSWKINFIAEHPHGDWQIFIDANSREVLESNDLSLYISYGNVFKPDPVTSLQNPSLTDHGDSNYSAIQNTYATVTLNNLNEPIDDEYRLQGRYASSENIEGPDTSPVTNHSGSFMYNRSQSGFEETNAYYFIDAQRTYIGGLGFAPQWNGLDYIRFDAHGAYGLDAAWYEPTMQYIAFGDGNIDAAEDHGIILHEYTHALHDAFMIGTGIKIYPYHESAISEGSADYLALSYRLTLSNYQPTKIFNWDETVRYLDPNYYYPAGWPIWYEIKDNPYDPAGILWASMMMDIENSSGMRRDITTKLLLTSFSYVSKSSTVIDHIHAILQADRDIYYGEHLSTLATVFYNRGFSYDQEVSGTISSNTPWSGNIFVTGDVTVNSGITLTISPNSFVFFNDGTSIFVNGTLSANGNSNEPIIFTSLNNNVPGNWNSIYFDGSSSTNSSLSNCQIQYGYAIECHSGTNVTIDHCNISNNVYGILCYSSSPLISNNLISNSTYAGIQSVSNSNPRIENNIIHNDVIANYAIGVYFYGGYGNINSNTISGFWVGVYSRAGSSVGGWNQDDYYDTPSQNNIIKENAYGLATYDNSWAFLGRYEIEDGTVHGGNNWIELNSYYDLNAADYTGLYGEDNWYGYDLVPSHIEGSNPYIFAWTTLDNNPWGGGSSKAVSDKSPLSLSKNATGGISYSKLSQDLLDENGDDDIFRDAVSAQLNKSFTIAQNKYSQLLSSRKYSKSALVLLSRLYIESDDVDNGLASYDVLRSNPLKNNLELENLPLTTNLLANMHGYKGNYDSALTLFDDVIKNYPNTIEERNARIQKIYFTIEEGKDQEGALQMLNELMEIYKTGDDITMIKNYVDHAILSSGEKSKIFSKKSKIENEAAEYSLSDNYPNPFNPTTTISYALPKAAKVSLKVYDALGREVSTLVNTHQESGRYNVSFDASKLSSGMYIYKLTSEKFSQVKKMMFVK